MTSGSGGGALTRVGRAVLDELAPVARRAVTLDPRTIARIRLLDGTATVYARLPFGVLVSRAVRMETGAGTDAEPEDSAAGVPLDLAVAAAELLAWLDGDADEPDRRDADWRSGLPPSTGWRRIETVPDNMVRPLVRSGALALKEAAEREGVPGAQPRAEVADALLDSVVLTVEDAPAAVEVTLRALSALTRMGFLPRGGELHVDVAGRWVRLAAQYGSVFLERPGSGLTLR